MLGILAVENHDRRLAVKITHVNTNIMAPSGTLPQSELVGAPWYCSRRMSGAIVEGTDTSPTLTLRTMDAHEFP